MDRPDWSALGGMIEEVQRAWSGIDAVQRQMRKVTGTAWSDDRTVKAVVGPRGHLLELEIDPRVYRRPNSKALATTIVDTVTRAIEDATRQTKEILDGSLPSDMRINPLIGTDLGRLIHSHDADTRIKGDDDE
jgi:DNA-binding protein YbaB